MSCPGRRVRSQSPNTFPRDTGPHKSPSPRWTGQRHPHPTEAPRVAAPGRWPSEALPPAGPTRRSREHGEYMSVGGTTVPIPPICQPLPPFPGMVAAKAGAGDAAGLGEEAGAVCGPLLPVPSPAAGVGMAALQSTGSRARPHHSLGPAAKLLLRNDRSGC